MKLTNVRSVRSLFVATLITSLALFSASCNPKQSSTNVDIPGIDGPKVNLLQDNLLISMVFENVSLEGGLRYNIPKYKDSYLEISPDLESNGTLMSISVSIGDLLDTNLQALPPQSLPGGRPLPGVSTGALPAVAFSVPKWKNMAFYIGPKFFGVFVPTRLDIGMNNILTFRYNIGSKRAGNLSMVGEDSNGENSGFLLLLDMNATAKRRLKRIMRKYN